MEKPKRWQFYLILIVVLATLYNILPTLFYYAQPLRDPIGQKRAEVAASSMIERVNALEEDATLWIHSYANLFKLKPQKVVLQANDPGLIEVTFPNADEAKKFRQYLSEAGSLIPFVPAQLERFPGPILDPNRVVVARKINIHLDPKEQSQLFHFFPKFDEKGKISSEYSSYIDERVITMALAAGGPSPKAQELEALVKAPDIGNTDDDVISIARDIVNTEKFYGKNSPLAKRTFASFTQTDTMDHDLLIQKFLNRLSSTSTRLDATLKRMKEEKELTQTVVANKKIVDSAYAFVDNNRKLFTAGVSPLTAANITTALKKTTQSLDPNDPKQVLSLNHTHPLIQAIIIDWSNDRIVLSLFEDVQTLRSPQATTESSARLKETLNQSIFNEVVRIGQASDETIRPFDDEFMAAFSVLPNSQSFLAMDLGFVAKTMTQQLFNHLMTSWIPVNKDLSRENYPVRSYSDYLKDSPEDQKLGLVIYAPAMQTEKPLAGLRPGSIYIIARNLVSLGEKYEQDLASTEAQMFQGDLKNLIEILRERNFISYPATLFIKDPSFARDVVFELPDFATNLIAATRENFTIKGNKRSAILPFTDVEQRILTRNRIDDSIQEDLLKWKEEYQSAQVDLNGVKQALVPKPTKNSYLANSKLNFSKYFRGDDKKVIKWGLDLSGGKTVRIGLVDQNNKAVTNPADLEQAVNELYTRINKLGVSERTIRIENQNILLEFPGAQGLSATDLVKASAMYFHIVNEKFAPNNPNLGDAVSRFLQDVWNEAVVTNRKDTESINEIAWQHLGGDTTEGEETRPMSAHAKLLYDNGLRIENPRTREVTGAFNDTLSSIQRFRGDTYSDWEKQSNPLLIVFQNYALEGSSLTNVLVNYDSTKGNTLSFGVKSSYDRAKGGNPRDDFFAWTSQFNQKAIAGTSKERYSPRGWRMAVILNNAIVSNPTLGAALSDGGVIEGRFTQREINQLAADLKAGSLTFTPNILSEQNVSAELGTEERIHGILASIIALALVVIAMVGYYRFAGFVATCAVFFNILMIWAVLQNLDAALTLPGIAGIVLTIGMAVDANVLVFERIREEFAISGRITSAIATGYRKAFSAILDSNVTTIIAAVILIQFDAGPIKAFAVTLIIGIVSSMFTALFMTRYFFAHWVQNPKHKELKMSHWIGNTKFNFLAYAKKAVWLSLAVVLCGGYLLYQERNSILGMDFTGGYSLNLIVEPKADQAYRQVATQALIAAGAPLTAVEVRQLTKPNQLRIQLGISLDQLGAPFAGMPDRLDNGKFTYPYQANPRMAWVVNALEKGGLEIPDSELADLDTHWSTMSGQFSDAMRNNALMAVGAALLSILLYITFRFEFKFAISSVIALAHDVAITLGILALFHLIGLPVQIDLQVIGALMTIIGYSLNDTIIVFDRIREDIKIMRKHSFPDIINHALNITLSRTLMTSGTTLLVLIALVLLGGQSIFAFALVMTIGVLVGTLSSLFIAAPTLLWLHNREEARQQTLART